MMQEASRSRTMSDCRNECINRDDRPDSYIMGWQLFFDGAPEVEYWNDPEVNEGLFKQGYQAAKLHKSHVEVCGHEAISTA